MKTKCLPLAAAVAILVTACFPSVHPFYTADDVLSDHRIVGEWISKDDADPETWAFEEDDDGGYQLTITDAEGRRGELKATLFRLDEEYFLDLFPGKCDFATNQAEVVSLCMIPGHLLVHVSQLEPTIRMAFCDPNWLGDYLKDHPKALPHRTGNGVVLTASTRQLQRFTLKHLRTGALFSEYGELTPKPPATE